MWSPLSLLPFLATLYSLSEAKPQHLPSVTFAPLSQLSPRSIQNIIVEYSGEVNGELTITYGSCDGASIISHQRIGATHVGSHPLAARHVDHEDRRPAKFVWLTPHDMNTGCLRAFLDDELVGQSEELHVTKRLARHKEKRAFKDVAGTDSMWFNGVSYLEQKQPDEVFVAAAKSKSIAILGAGLSGLLSSVGSCHSRVNMTKILIIRRIVIARLCWYS